MRILLLDQFSDPGGAQQCLLDLLPAFRERDWRVLVGLPGQGKLFDAVRAEGFQAERIDIRSLGRGSARDIRELARQVDAELLYINGPRLLPVAAMAGIPARVVFHSHSYLKPVARTVARAALRKLRARVMASCKFVGRQWGPSTRVIYNGVRVPNKDTDHKKRWSVPLETNSNIDHNTTGSVPPTIGCIGRISPEKGQVEFVKAARLIQRALPDARFSIYGAALFSGASYEANVREAAAGLPIEFHGWVDDVYAALAELDLLLVPSTGPEATTRVILEAYAAGVPVIAFQVGGIAEVVDHGRTGFLADSTEDMARLAIELLAGDPQPVIRAAHERYRRDFTLERYRDQIIDFLVK
jgi:glycosyltransferase involved in cell wall biosynthesis